MGVCGHRFSNARTGVAKVHACLDVASNDSLGTQSKKVIDPGSTRQSRRPSRFRAAGMRCCDPSATYSSWLLAMNLHAVEDAGFSFIVCSKITRDSIRSG